MTNIFFINKLFKIAGSAVRSFGDGLKKNLVDIQVSEVTKVLDNIEIKKSQYTTEKNVENIISKSLHTAFGVVHQQYSIGGYLALKIDMNCQKYKLISTGKHTNNI